MTPSIQIYCMAHQDRSDRVRWLLEELGQPYTDVFLKKSAGELNTPAYRALNPMGRVPTLVDGSIVVHESAGICLYLADRYGYGKLCPRSENHQERALYNQWMTFSTGSLECVVARMFTHVRTPEEKAVTHAFVEEQCNVFKKLLNPILEKQEYILSSGFSAADIMLGAVIPGAEPWLMANNPPIQNYMKRLMARPAAVKAKVF
jgi:glutathione S-transferase